MANDVTRRNFLRTAGAGAAAAAALSEVSAQDAEEAKPLKIVGVACSLRKGMTTASAMNVCLAAAAAVAPKRIEVELIELAGLKIPAGPAAGIALEPGQPDDFPGVAAKLSDPKVGGIIVGTPVYFGSMSSLCKAFLERFVTFRREGDFALANKVAGALAVGSSRNGGQELTIRSIQTALFGQEMIFVGDGRPTAHWGAALWNHWKDDIAQDADGLATAKNLGRRVAEVALMLRP